MRKKKRTAILILHEIYGVNQFIQEKVQNLKSLGFDVYSPNLLHREAFSYENVKEAYEYFTKQIGFETYAKINDMVMELKESYEKVFLLGFSVGGTIAWRCSEAGLCDGVIAFYGSRIRDYTDVVPNCPTLLLFASKDSFPVDELTEQLSKKTNATIRTFDASHGFMDPYGGQYCAKLQEQADENLLTFIRQYTVTK